MWEKNIKRFKQQKTVFMFHIFKKRTHMYLKFHWSITKGW